jgi:hypothetical protein
VSYHLVVPQVPTVTTEPRVQFLRGFPRIGGYVAAAVPAGPAGPASGAYHAVLAADTLLPDGHGQALTQQEVRECQVLTVQTHLQRSKD